MQLQCNVCVANEEKRQAHNNEEMTSTNCDGVATVIDIDTRSRFSPLVEMRFDGEHSLSNFSHLIFVCFAACKHKFSAVPSTHGIFEAVVVSRAAVEDPSSLPCAAVEDPSSLPATQTYALPSEEAQEKLRKRVARYRAELAHAKEGDLPENGDGSEKITWLMCGDLGDTDHHKGDVVDVIYNGSWFEAEVPFATYL
jgi:hypothetical protein